MSFADGHGLGFNPISRGAIDAKLPPVILTRKDNNGRKISVAVGTNVRSGIEFTATTERKTMDLNVIELDAGSWVIVEMPGFNQAASGTAQDSLDALRKASTTSYYKGADALWVKLVSTGEESRGMGGGVTVQVSR
jgi:hypothetical protein